ncbi:hypothetical protein KAV79_00795 [Candidatus Aerophobetes bacterium]|nr:hypothetical protein [Candidatus Aerophobetes bacterium]
MLRMAVEYLSDILENCKKLKNIFRESIKKCISFIPEILYKEKKQIEDKLNKIPKNTRTIRKKIGFVA